MEKTEVKIYVAQEIYMGYTRGYIFLDETEIFEARYNHDRKVSNENILDRFADKLLEAME